jgi:hypothetical protein
MLTSARQMLVPPQQTGSPATSRQIAVAGQQ